MKKIRKIISLCIIGIMMFQHTGITSYATGVVAEELTAPSGISYSDIPPAIENYVEEHKETTTGMSVCKKQVLFDIFRQFISGTFRQSKTSTFIIAYISRGLLPGFSCSIFFRFIEMVILHQDLIAEKLFPQVNPSE